MGTCYSHIDLKERIKLFDLARSGILSVTELARMLGRHRSTVYREISRNFHHDVYADFRGWFPSTADMRARRRRRKTAKGATRISHNWLQTYSSYCIGTAGGDANAAAENLRIHTSHCIVT